MHGRLVSWNVNGIRSCTRKGFFDWLRRAKPDLVALQEVRCENDDLPPEFARLRRYTSFETHPARSKKGYSGVAILSREKPIEVIRSLGDEQFDREGRFLLVRFDDVMIASGYFPKGSGNERDNSRVPYKLDFTRRAFQIVNRLRKKHDLPALMMGDFNIAPNPIDLARPKGNEKTSGFLPEERELFAELLDQGSWLDTYRELYPEKVEYSWWSNRFGVREKNIGWRIDHAVASKDLMPRIEDSFIWTKVKGSDHCPIGVDLGEAQG